MKLFPNELILYVYNNRADSSTNYTISFKSKTELKQKIMCINGIHFELWIPDRWESLSPMFSGSKEKIINEINEYKFMYQVDTGNDWDCKWIKEEV